MTILCVSTNDNKLDGKVVGFKHTGYVCAVCQSQNSCFVLLVIYCISLTCRFSFYQCNTTSLPHWFPYFGNRENFPSKLIDHISKHQSQRATPAVQSNFCIIWLMNSNFYLLTIHFFKYTFNRLSISFKYYFFIHSLSSFILPIFIPNNYIFNEKYYIYNIFRNIFTIKFMQKVVTNSNLNSPLKLFFFSPILTDKKFVT